MMVYFSDGTSEMILKAGQCWDIVEERLGYDFRKYMEEQEYVASQERELNCYEKINEANMKLYDLLEAIEPMTKKDGKIGKLFGNIYNAIQNVEYKIEDAMDELKVDLEDCID